MNASHLLVLGFFFASFFLLNGCTEVPGLPYTTSQFIARSTDLDYNLFVDGNYANKLVFINSSSKFDVTDFNGEFIVGPTGPQGPPGVDGNNGLDGNVGPQGPPGLDGNGVSDHNALNNLGWSLSGHFLDSNFDLNGNYFKTNAGGSGIMFFEDSVYENDGSLILSNRQLYNSLGKDTVDWESAILSDQFEVPALEWITRELKDSNSVTKFNWNLLAFPTLTTDGCLKTTNSDGTIVVGDCGGGTLSEILLAGNTTEGNDIAFNTDGDVITDGINSSIDPYNRTLGDSTGYDNLNWSTEGALGLFSTTTDATKTISFYGTSNTGTINYDTTTGFFSFSSLFTDGTNNSIDPNNRILYTNDGVTEMLDWTNTANDNSALSFSSGATQFGSTIQDTLDLTSIDPNNRILYSGAQYKVLEWNDIDSSISTIKYANAEELRTPNIQAPLLCSGEVNGVLYIGGSYNGENYYQFFGVWPILWYDSGSSKWVISGVVGSEGTNGWKSRTSNMIDTYDGYGAYSGTADVAYGKIEISNAYTLPNVDGSDGQVLTTDGAGVVTWESVVGGSGTDTNWETSWVTFDANMKATYPVFSDVFGWIDGNKGAGGIDTNWQTSWTEFDANMRATYNLPATGGGGDLNTTMGLGNWTTFDLNMNQKSVLDVNNIYLNVVWADKNAGFGTMYCADGNIVMGYLIGYDC